MEITRNELEQMIQEAADKAVATATATNSLENPIVYCGSTAGENPPENKRSAYAKTESLLYNYKNFKRIVEQKLEEIRTIQECGVPQRSKSIVQWSGVHGSPQKILLPSESVESAIRSVHASVEKILWAVGLIEANMKAIESDPYYPILEMRYFNGYTQEQIALELGCSQVTVSKNKKRLVRELAMRMFPEQVIDEMLR